MDHGNMGHGDVGDMPMPMPEMCSMNVSEVIRDLSSSCRKYITDSHQMLFNWDTDNLCIIFRSWHIKSPLSLFISLLAIVALVAGYELFRAAVHRYALRAKQRVELLPSGSSPFLMLLLLPLLFALRWTSLEER